MATAIHPSYHVLRDPPFVEALTTLIGDCSKHTRERGVRVVLADSEDDARRHQERARDTVMREISPSPRSHRREDRVHRESFFRETDGGSHHLRARQFPETLLRGEQAGHVPGTPTTRSGADASRRWHVRRETRRWAALRRNRGTRPALVL